MTDRPIHDDETFCVRALLDDLENTSSTRLFIRTYIDAVDPNHATLQLIHTVPSIPLPDGFLRKSCKSILVSAQNDGSEFHLGFIILDLSSYRAAAFTCGRSAFALNVLVCEYESRLGLLSRVSYLIGRLVCGLEFDPYDVPFADDALQQLVERAQECAVNALDQPPRLETPTSHPVYSESLQRIKDLFTFYSENQGLTRYQCDTIEGLIQEIEVTISVENRSTLRRLARKEAVVGAFRKQNILPAQPYLQYASDNGNEMCSLLGALSDQSDVYPNIESLSVGINKILQSEFYNRWTSGAGLEWRCQRSAMLTPDEKDALFSRFMTLWTASYDSPLTPTRECHELFG